MPDQLVPVDNKRLDWPRLVANGVNGLSVALKNIVSRVTAIEAYRDFPFRPLSNEPDNPGEGQSYYDTTTHKARTFDGTVWQDHW